MGSALSEESIADFAAAELVSAQNSASPAVKPRLIANRMKMVDDGDASSPQQQDNALDSKEAPGNVELRGAAMTIQRALRAKKEAEGLKRTFNLADISKAAVKVEEKRKLAARIAESEAAQLFRDKNWFSLRKHMEYHSIKAAGDAGETAEVETRDRHSLVSLALPNDVDEEDKRHLRDEQVRPSP